MSTDDEFGQPEVILVGEVLKAFGIRGEVAVKTFTENPRRFREGSVLMVGASYERANPIKIDSARPDERFRDRLIVAFEGIDGRNSAEKLHGSLIFVDSTELARPDEDGFWEFELVGAEVFDMEGRKLGTISAILAREEQDLWEVATGAEPVLLPAAKDLIVSVDAAEKKVVVDPPKGLFDAV